MTEHSEDYIINACQQHDIHAQKELYRRHVDKLYYVILRYVKDKFYIENLLQDIFLKAFIHLSKFDKTKASFATWIKTIAIRESINHCKKRSTAFLPIDEINNSHHVLEVSNVLSQLNANDILAVIARIPDKYSIIFNLYEIDGYSHPEIAKLLGVSEGTSRSYLSRSKKMIQDQLEGIYSLKKVSNEAIL